MPLHEFRCQHCGHQFERIVKMSDPNPSCPAMRTVFVPGADGGCIRIPCGRETIKIISVGTFHLKGSGWASDGYGG